jgi:hypothetical protein
MAKRQSDEETRHECAISTMVWGKMFSGLTAVTYGEKGADALHQLWFLFLTTHQGEKYHEGLRKLGIENDPPAVAAAKYHYFTNIIGGLAMEYVEESPRKAWIRYLAPMWMYGGVAVMAMPSNLRRHVFSSWHPRNGQYMGCPRLGYVGTKFSSEADPSDEGYFYEYDYDLAPSQIMRFEIAHKTPEFDPDKAPKLDPTLWPEMRMLKARRNFSSGYFRVTIDVLDGMYGELITNHIIARTMRFMGIQFTPEIRKLVGVDGSSVEAVADLFARILRAQGQDFALEKVNAKTSRLTVRSFRPLGEISEDRRRSLFEFQKMVGRMINGRLSIARSRGQDGADVWEITDTGVWQW